MKNVTILKEKRIPIDLLNLCRDNLEKKNFNVIFADYEEEEQKLLDKLLSSQAILCCPGRFLKDSLILKLKSNVKLFQLWSSGYDKFNVNGCTKVNIPVCNNGGANSRSVAEHTILLMLAGSRGMWECMNRVKKGLWGGNRHGLDFQTLYKKKIGIVGLGKIGKIVVEMLNGFGCQIHYYDIKRDLEFERLYKIKFLDLKNLFLESDIISLHLHLNDKTKNIISKSLINSMKKGSRLINVSRAQLVDSKYVEIALNEGTLSSYCSDVFDIEPNSKNDELIRHPNFIGTPHTAGSTYDTYVNAIKTCIDNIEKSFKNEKLKFVVNPEVL